MENTRPVKRKAGLNLYQKFALVIVLAGILPIAALSTVILDRMFREYGRSLRENYTQGLRYASDSIEQLFDSYNDISKFSYYYSYTSEGSFSYAYINYDNLRQILTGENYPEEGRRQRTQQEVQAFLRNVLKMNSTIEEVHFLHFPQEGGMVDYHAGNFNNRFASLSLFSEAVGLDQWDKESRLLIIVPTHPFGYVQNGSKRTSQVFTIARNYYDLKGMVGKEKYVGTLFVDFDISQIENIFQGIDLYSRGKLYVYNAMGDCFYSNKPELIGKNLVKEGVPYAAAQGKDLFLLEKTDKYGLEIYFELDGPVADERMLGIRKLMYIIVVLAAVILSLASVSFSRRLTRPMRVMMERMGDIEAGRFEGELPVASHDEIGRLSARFNKMSTELRNYTNQMYVSKIKQTEAELNALKSQIYPHFLYNTLEVIRMTAVNNGDGTVASMVESLGDQIRYLIGTVSDIVTLRDEISNLEKYIYLINCRYGDRISFCACTEGLGERYVPKLVLQPIVENAYVHGLKDKDGQGRIQLNINEKQGDLEITVLDNGQGMTPEEVLRVEDTLKSAKSGEKTETGWRSVGLKNVHDRLRFLYGEAYGVTLFSTPGVGTAVTLRLPGSISPKEEDHVADDSGR